MTRYKLARYRLPGCNGLNNGAFDAGDIKDWSWVIGQLHHPIRYQVTGHTQSNKIGLLGYDICNAINQAIC